MPVFCEQKGYELRVNGLVAAEISTQEAAYEIAVHRGVITGEVYVFDCAEEAFKIVSEFLHLGGFSGSVQAFQYYEHINMF